MTATERTGKRDLRYSAWHRPASLIQRGHLDVRDATTLLMCDIDAVEVCNWCGRPVALIETQVSHHDPKPATWMAKLAEMAGIPAYSVSLLFDTDTTPEPTWFRVRQLKPLYDPVLIDYTPRQFAGFLLKLRAPSPHHQCTTDSEGHFTS